MQIISSITYSTIPEDYDMNMAELKLLLNQCDGCRAAEAVYNAYKYGYVMGSRAERAGANIKKL